MNESNENMNSAADKKHYLLIYLLMSFGISWGITIAYIVFYDVLNPIIGDLTLTNPVVMLVLYAPTLAGLTIYYLYGGFKGIGSIFYKLVPEKKDLVWFPVIFVIALLFYLCMHFGSILLGIPVPDTGYTLPEMIHQALRNLFEETGLIGGAFGWIGFMLPYLQGKLKDNRKAAVISGLAFGLFVMPGYLISSFETATSYPLYVLQLVLFVLFFSYLFNATKGNLGFYIFTFWLMATGSRLKLYYFEPRVQVLQIAFFIVLCVVMMQMARNKKLDQEMQVFPDYIERKTETRAPVSVS